MTRNYITIAHEYTNETIEGMYVCIVEFEAPPVSYSQKVNYKSQKQRLFPKVKDEIKSYETDNGEVWYEAELRSKQVIQDSAECLSPVLQIKKSDVQNTMGHLVKKLPYSERSDLAQHLTIKALENSENIQSKPSWMFTLLKRDCQDYAKKFYTYEHESLSRVINPCQALASGDDNELTLSDVIASEVEFERISELKSDVLKLWELLSNSEKSLVQRKIAGTKLTNGEKSQLRELAVKFAGWEY